MYLTPSDNPLIAAVCKVAFPDYTGKKCQLHYTDHPINMASYWSGGSRNFYVIVRLSDMKVMSIPQQSMFDPQINGIEAFVIPQGYVVVEHCIFCGKDMGLTVNARTDGIKLIAEQAPELTRAEIMVLVATKALKSSYGGVSDYRAHELRRKGLTMKQVDDARRHLRELKLLDARNAITNAGRNVVAEHPERLTMF